MYARKPIFAPARTVTVVALIVAAAGIGVQAIAGVSMPIVPPGLVILVVGAAVVALVAKRWAPAVGVAAAVAELAGFVAVGAVDKIVDPSAFGVFAGAWLRLLGCVVAIVAGVLATRMRMAPAATAK